MSRRAKRWTSALIIAFAIAMLGNVLVWREDARRREKRAEISALVRVGQPIEEATATLREHGFLPLYDSAIAPSIDRSYLTQYFKISEKPPNLSETFGYILQLPWVPYSTKEGTYVILRASLDGTITRIE